MSRNLDHLISVFGDLESRYGSDDEVVLDMKSALESRQVAENKKFQGWSLRKLSKSSKTLSSTERPGNQVLRW